MAGSASFKDLESEFVLFSSTLLNLSGNSACRMMFNLSLPGEPDCHCVRSGRYGSSSVQPPANFDPISFGLPK